MEYEFSKEAKEYKRKPVSKEYKENFLLDMILNNMKIEGQEVSRERYLAFRKEIKQKRGLDKK